MLRTTAPRQLLRQQSSSLQRPLALGRRIGGGGAGVRYQSTAVPRRSFKNGLLRWGLAIGGTYWYMTSPIFNDKPAYVVQDGPDAKLQTYDSVKPSKKMKPPHEQDAPIVPSTPSSNSPPSINPKSPDPNAVAVLDGEEYHSDSSVDPEAALALEEEAASQGAFNEETGEINWDCPCLGGMAYGPCGTSFREAFSCFVFSKEEPKGMDCIDRFEAMQACFREHPEIYASEIADDDAVAADADAALAREKKEANTTGGPDVDQPSVWTPLANEQQEKQQEEAKAEKREKKLAQQTDDGIRKIQEGARVERQGGT